MQKILIIQDVKMNKRKLYEKAFTWSLIVIVFYFCLHIFVAWLKIKLGG